VLCSKCHRSVHAACGPESRRTMHTLESFNWTLRAECLDAHWFASPTEAVKQIESWRREYNESRPHRALGERTPQEFAR
jgi:transposase InsO family protein